MFIAERFSASRASRRERSGSIAKSQAVFDAGAANILMYEARIKTVARTDGIKDFNVWWSRRKFFIASPRDRAAWAALHHHDRHVVGERAQRVCRFAFSRKAIGLAFIEQQQINIFQERVNVARPAILRIIVGVERRRQTMLLGLPKKLRQSRLHAFLQKIRRQMHMLGVENMIQIKIGDAHFGHGAGIRKDEALFSLRKNHGKAGGFFSEAPHARKIDTTLA